MSQALSRTDATPKKPDAEMQLRLARTDAPTAPPFQRNIDEAIELFLALRDLQPAVNAAADLMVNALSVGGKLLTCGNGGSASDATHIATEFVVRFKDDRRPYPAISLNEIGSTLTAIGNDYSFSDVFARQVAAFGQADDVLIAITTSGNSDNIHAALEEATRLGMRSIALLGRDGGVCKGIGEVDIIVPGTSTARIQEAHTLIYHTLCEMVERRLPKAWPMRAA